MPFLLTKQSLLLFFLPFIAQIVGAQVSYSNEFLNIGVSAHAQGMANAHIASVDDVTAAYWNPAGLSQLDSNTFQVAAMHAEWFAGIANYDYVGIGKSMKHSKKSAFALSMIRLAVDQIPNTLQLISPDGTINYDNVTEFSAADYAIFLSYARAFRNSKKWFIGGSAKVIRRVVGRFGSSWGFGLDLGVQYRGKHWQFAAMGRDLTSTFNAWTFNFNQQDKEVFLRTGNDIPISTIEITRPRIILGAAYKRDFLNRQFQLRSELNVDVTTDGQRNVLLSAGSFSVAPQVGLQLGYFLSKKIKNDEGDLLSIQRKDVALFFRAGIGNIQQLKDDNNPEESYYSLQPNIGIGIQIKKLVIDYAFTDIGDVSRVLYSHIFSIRLNFNRKQRPSRKIIEELPLHD